MKTIILSLSFVCTILLSACKTQKLSPEEQESNKTKKELAIQNRIKKNIEKLKTPEFTFYPDQIEPKFGTSHILRGGSYLKVNKKNIESELPYWGRFYARPTNLGDIPIQFVSTEYTYMITTNDSLNYYIQIIPTDATRRLNQGIMFDLYLNVENNTGKLCINADNRDEISFYGSFR